MIDSNIIPDESIMNLFLENCFLSNNKDDVKLGLKTFEEIRKLNIRPSAITFSILIKLYGKNKDLYGALDVIGDLKRYRLYPGLIIYTNLITICFNLKNPV